MLRRLGFTFETLTVALMISSLVLTITQLFLTSWCSASGEYYGYYFDGQYLRSCVIDFPARDFISVAASLTTGFGILSMLIEWAAAAFRWRNFRELNFSRILFVISFLVIDYLLQDLANALPREWGFDQGWAFDNFFWLFPTALLMFIAASFTIYKKIELVFVFKR
jgi:hypothetical protein